MRLNFTGRRKIDKQHARIFFVDDPAGSKRGYYFDLTLDLDSYNLPSNALVFAEATRGAILMRFNLGCVGELALLTPDQRRLSAFVPDPDGVKFRIKVTQPDGEDAGKLLGEADGIHPEEGGASPLIRIAGDGTMGQTPWRLELVPTDSDLPTLYIHTSLGGKEYAKDPVAKPLLQTAAAREVFSKLIWAGDHEDEPDHWASLWGRFATEVLHLRETTGAEDWSEEEQREWIEQAVNAFAAKFSLVNGLESYKANLELQELEEIN